MSSELKILLEKNVSNSHPNGKRTIKKNLFIESTRNQFFAALILCALTYFLTSRLLISEIRKNSGGISISEIPLYLINTVKPDKNLTKSTTVKSTTKVSTKSMKITTTQNPETIETTPVSEDKETSSTEIPDSLDNVTELPLEVSTSDIVSTTETNEKANDEPQTTLKTIKNQQSCKIPKLNPRDRSILHLIEKYPDQKCTQKYEFLFEMGNNSTLTKSKEFVTSALEYKDCCYKVISRADYTKGGDPDNREILSKNCNPVTENQTQIPSEHEFILVYCKIYNSTDDENESKNLTAVDAIAFAPLKPLLEKKISKIEKEKKLDSKKRVNLVVLGIDAVSHMNFIRTMPKVQKYLMNNLSALSMNGYTKIGDNTYPNIAAVLTPWNSTEIDQRCRNETKPFFDDCPFLFHNFSAEGYRTSYGEDSPWIGIFNYLKKGFKKPPVDYYFRPFARMVERHIAHNLKGNTKWCYGSKLSIEVLLNYMKQLASTMGHARRFFQFIWATSITHDHLNACQISEPSILSTLQWYEKEGHLNNTIFVLMSDHGIRYGSIRNFRQGKIEESMPFIYFVLPKWFKEKYKSAIKNMRENQDRLTTPYDVYETFQDILYLENIDEKSLAKRQVKLRSQEKNNKIPRGISMFLPVPKSRTCKMAEIAEHWCICHNAVKTDSKSAVVKQAANFAVYTLNSFIANHSKCAYLALSTVFEAHIVYAQNSQKYAVGKNEKIYELTFRTTPGDALFDATVIQKVKLGKWQISGDISRTNLYGNQSYCVDDKEMKKYCFCIEPKR